MSKGNVNDARRDRMTKVRTEYQAKVFKIAPDTGHPVGHSYREDDLAISANRLLDSKQAVR